MYFHGSSVESLEDLIEYKNQAVSENERVTEEYMSPKFQPLNLTETEKENLVAFLERGLRDPDLERYLPTSIKSGFCYPNNDPISQDYLDCK